MSKQVKDAFATLNPNNASTLQTHPFATFLRFTDGTHSQSMECRNLRDCLLVGNGMTAALMALGIEFQTINVVFDERFDR